LSPEVANFDPVCFASDMWSVGVITFVLLSGLSPFMGETIPETYSNVIRAEYDFEDPVRIVA
jgi:myosin-light-chain kinase